MALLRHLMVVICCAALGGVAIFEVQPLNQTAHAETRPATAAEAKVRIWTAILTDGETGLPLENIPVEVRCWKTGHREPRPMTFTSGSGGEVKIPLAAGTTTPVLVKGERLWTYGSTVIGDLGWQIPEANKSLVADPTVPLRIRVWKGTEVRGRLLKPDGTPAADLDLYFSVYIGHSEWKTRLMMPSKVAAYWQTVVTTGADGDFSATVPPAAARTWLKVSTVRMFATFEPRGLHKDDLSKALADYLHFEYRVPETTTENDNVLNLGRLQLEKGVSVKGRVLDAAGKPLAKTRLHTTSTRNPLGGRTTESAADGSFEFAPMLPGSYLLLTDPPVHPNGEVNAGLAEAVFLAEDIDVPDSDVSVNLTVQAVPHVHLEFEWIDRRMENAPSVRDIHFQFGVSGQMRRPDARQIPWYGAAALSTVDGKQVLHLIAPATLLEATLHFPNNQVFNNRVISLSYECEGYKHGPGRVPLGDITKPRRRIIYGDEPLAEKK